jgi:hypothetical protein
MYLLSKSKPPMDVEFMVMDTLELLRPNLQLTTSYEDANEAVDQMLLDQLKAVQGIILIYVAWRGMEWLCTIYLCMNIIRR